MLAQLSVSFVHDLAGYDEAWQIGVKRSITHRRQEVINTEPMKIFRPPHLVGVMWKTVSEDCNLACDYCYYSRIGGKIEGKIKRIDGDVLKKFIGEYMELSHGVAAFVWQGGEPLLAGLDFFRDVTALQAKYAPPHTLISNAVQTNATLLTDEMARFFKRYNFLLGVSVDGPREIHNARRVSRSGHGSFDRVMKGIQLLRKYGVDFNIITVLHKGNVNRAADLMEFFQAEAFQYLQFIPGMDFLAQQPGKPPRYLISAEEYAEFMCQVFDLWYNEANPKMSIRFFDNMLRVYLNREAELCAHRETCPTTLVLQQNGDAYPCDFYISEEYRLGNVGQDSLTAILQNHVRHRFLSQKPRLPKPCGTCEFLRLCHGGCPRNRRWRMSEEEVDVDYFCESYRKVYTYTHERMERLAERTREVWLREYRDRGHKARERNQPCICGSGLAYKNCCGVVEGQFSLR